MQNSYNKIFFEYYEYILDVLNMCITDMFMQFFPCLENHTKEKPRVPIPKTNKFEEYYDSEDSLDQEYDLV